MARSSDPRQLALRLDEPLRVVVDNRVRFSVHGFSDQLVEELKDLFTHPNPDKEDEKGPAFYRTWQHEGDELALPRGGMARVREFLKSHDLPFAIKDQRITGDRSFLDNDWQGRPIPPHTITLRDWQKDAVKLILAKQNCILRAPTGSGKTTAGLSLFSQMNISTIVVVPTRGLIQQWCERLMSEMKLQARDIGIIGDGKHKTAPVTISTQAALAVGIRPNWLKAFGAIIYDETHKAAAPTAFAAVDPWPAKYRIGISADERRHDAKEFLIYDLFGDVAAHITHQEVLDAGHTVEVEIRLLPSDFQAPWYKDAVSSGNKFWLRNAHHKLLKTMWQDKERNVLIHRTTRREVKDGQQIMVLSERREHCLQLDQAFTKMGLKCGIMLGGAEARSQFDITKQGIRDGSLSVVTGTIAAIGTGQDFPSLTSGLVVMPIHNNKQLFEQVRGRFARSCESIGKTKATLYYIWDVHVHGKRPLENMIKWNKRVQVWDKVQEKWVEGSEYFSSLHGIMGMKKRPDFSKTTPTIGDLVGE